MKRILELLRRAYGPRPWQRWGNGVDILVGTILSQNTSDTSSAAGFRHLRRQFRSWNQVMNAPVDAVEKAIRISGLSRIKAPRIQNILRQIKEDRGKIDLEFLKDLPPEEAFEYLTRFKGVGPKTANCVLLFSFGMPLFPVDTHIHRIALRLELIPARSTAEQAHDLLAPMIAPEDRYETHVLLITHGRQTCRARNPLCSRCALLPLCPFGQRRLKP
ncbi:MAG: endonuclease III domain-containing protein [Bacillota bacterium]